MNRLLSCLRLGFLFGGGLLFGARSVMAGSVTTDDASPLTKCSSYTSMAVTPVGNVIITGCTLSQINAIFEITAATTATMGVNLPVTVTRTIPPSGMPGSDILTLTSTVAGAFTPPTVSFVATDGFSSTKSSFIKFSAAGTGTLSATGTTTVTPSNQITVSASTTTGCSNAISSRDLGVLPAGGGVKYSITSPLALRFRISPSDPVGQQYAIQYEDSIPAALHNALDTVISTCSGDFSASGMTGTQALCKVTNSAGGGPILSVNSTAHCRVEPNVDYYINIRPTPGVGESAFLFMLV